MTDRLQAVALEDADADLVVTGGRVLTPEGSLRERDVAVVGDRVAAVPADAAPLVGSGTTVVDASDHTVVPGLVDAHDHLDINAVFERGYHRWLERGVTAVVTETSSVGQVGADGVEAFLSATADLPVAVLGTVPPQPFVPTDGGKANGGDAGTRKRLRELLGHDRVVGVGEVGWASVVGEETPELDRLCERAGREGKRVVGHGAGCRGRKLAAFASVVDNDHEPTRPEGVTERLGAGLHVVGRRGSIRDDLEAVAAAERPRGDVSLCTDGTWPGDGAGMDDVVAAAIQEGIDPVEAVEMATRNPAREFGLTERGTIAPGQRADLVVLSDLAEVTVESVVAGGSLVVEDGAATVEPRPHDYPEDLLSAVSVSLAPDCLAVPASAGRSGRVRAIERSEGLVTRATTVEPPDEDGHLRAAPESDLLKVALFDRRPGRDRGFVGFVRGGGIDRGGVATTLTWERPGLIAVGASDDALREAVERVTDLGGGWAVVGNITNRPDESADRNPNDGESDPRVLADLAMPVAGVCADASREVVAARYEEIAAALVELGAPPDPGMPRASEGEAGPILGLQTLAFPGVPALKMSFSGYLDVIAGETVGLDPGSGG